MTRRKIIFYNDLNNSYIVSEEFNGDKSEMEQFGLGTCDHTWTEFMETMSMVDKLSYFLSAISWISGSYHPSVNDVLLPSQDNDLPGTRLDTANSSRELYALVGDMDEVWEFRRGVCGARLFDTSTIAPVTWNGKPVLDTDEFYYSVAKPGDYVTQAVVDEAINCLPPVCMRSDCSQMGEPYDTKLDDRSGKWRNTYATFRKVAGKWPNGIWEYCGHCFCGETEER